MDVSVGGCNTAAQGEEDMDIRKGPWTAEEDLVLKNYISMYGEGRWNSLARCAGLKRTGKSCRLRWLNYLRPDVVRGNITLQEQLVILDLHSRWGNRWSKIAQYLPGRTDNEIKNYWRTRVQKQAKQLKCDVNSKQFRETMRCVWIPRLLERIRAASESSMDRPAAAAATAQAILHMGSNNEFGYGRVDPIYKPDISGASSDSSENQVSPDSCLTDSYNIPGCNYSDSIQDGPVYCPELVASPCWHSKDGAEFQALEQSYGWLGGGDSLENMWSDEDILFLQQHLYDDFDV